MRGERPRTSSENIRLAILPLGSRGSSSTNTTDVGHLKCERRSRQYCRSSSAMASSSSAGSANCTTARTDSPISGCGTPMTATSCTDGVPDQHVLGLAGVDVHAARDDHVRHPVGQVHVAVVVDVADVAERHPARDRPRPRPSSPCRRGTRSGSTTRTRAVPPRRWAARCRPRRRRARRRAGACRPSRGARASPRSRCSRTRRPRCPRSTRAGSGRRTRSRRASRRAGTAPPRARSPAGSTGRTSPARPRSSFRMRTRWVGTNCTCVTR